MSKIAAKSYEALQGMIDHGFTVLLEIRGTEYFVGAAKEIEGKPSVVAQGSNAVLPLAIARCSINLGLHMMFEDLAVGVDEGEEFNFAPHIPPAEPPAGLNDDGLLAYFGLGDEPDPPSSDAAIDDFLRSLL